MVRGVRTARGRFLGARSGAVSYRPSKSQRFFLTGQRSYSSSKSRQIWEMVKMAEV